MRSPPRSTTILEEPKLKGNLIKLLLIVISILFTFAVGARELDCKTEVDIYKIPGKGVINICHDKKTEISFYALAFNDGHQCGMSGSAKLKGDKYIFKSRSCKVWFSFHGDTLNAEFGDCWQGFCGMRANWQSGDYLK